MDDIAEHVCESQSEMSIRIHGAPKPLKRQRFSHNRVYDPSAGEKADFRRKVLGCKPRCFHGPIEVAFEYGIQIPKSYSKRKRREYLGRTHAIRPDISNLIKFTEDALNGVLWDDDAQIHTITARKIYVDEPYTDITIWEEDDLLK